MLPPQILYQLVGLADALHGKRGAVHHAGRARWRRRGKGSSRGGRGCAAAAGVTLWGEDPPGQGCRLLVLLGRGGGGGGGGGGGCCWVHEEWAVAVVHVEVQEEGEVHLHHGVEDVRLQGAEAERTLRRGRGRRGRSHGHNPRSDRGKHLTVEAGLEDLGVTLVCDPGLWSRAGMGFPISVNTDLVRAVKPVLLSLRFAYFVEFVPILFTSFSLFEKGFFHSFSHLQCDQKIFFKSPMTDVKIAKTRQFFFGNCPKLPIFLLEIVTC